MPARYSNGFEIRWKFACHVEIWKDKLGLKSKAFDPTKSIDIERFLAWMCDHFTHALLLMWPSNPNWRKERKAHARRDLVTMLNIALFLASSVRVSFVCHFRHIVLYIGSTTLKCSDMHLHGLRSHPLSTLLLKKTIHLLLTGFPNITCFF